MQAVSIMSHTNSPSTKASLMFLNIDMRLSRTLRHQMWGSPLDLGPTQRSFVPGGEFVDCLVELSPAMSKNAP